MSYVAIVPHSRSAGYHREIWASMYWNHQTLFASWRFILPCWIRAWVHVMQMTRVKIVGVFQHKYVSISSVAVLSTYVALNGCILPSKHPDYGIESLIPLDTVVENNTIINKRYVVMWTHIVFLALSLVHRSQCYQTNVWLFCHVIMHDVIR